jgi:glycosyltransferase involved in cell wall biosynthesis
MPRESKPRVYVTHQSLHDHVGGASSVTAWVLQALSRDFDVVLATSDPVVDFSDLDETYGTSLSKASIGLQPLAIPSWLRELPPRVAKSLRLAAAFRHADFRYEENAVIINTANEMSFVGVAANYVHCPIRHRRMVRELFDGPERWLRLANNAMFKAVSRFDEQSFRRSTCVANSEWTAGALRRTYGLEARVIYPPVTCPPRAPKPLADRSPGFVCIGRITAEKRTHEAIEVVDELRRQGHDVHLHLVGTGTGPYARGVEMRVAASPHVQLHRRIPRAELADLLEGHRFGLHMMHNEHFGMAVAEMASAGMLVLAHDSAGPTEILGEMSPLLFADASEATVIAARLLGSTAFREDVMAELAARGIANAFAPQEFMRSIRRVADEAVRPGVA